MTPAGSRARTSVPGANPSTSDALPPANPPCSSTTVGLISVIAATTSEAAGSFSTLCVVLVSSGK